MNCKKTVTSTLFVILFCACSCLNGSFLDFLYSFFVAGQGAESYDEQAARLKQLLVKRKYDELATPVFFGWTPLHYAAYANDEAKVRELLSDLPPEYVYSLVSKTQANNTTPLYFAVQHNNFKMVTHMLCNTTPYEKYLICKIADRGGKTVLYKALDKTIGLDEYDYWLHYKQNNAENKTNIIVYLIENMNLEHRLQLLSLIRIEDEPVLHHFLQENNLERIRFLIPALSSSLKHQYEAQMLLNFLALRDKKNQTALLLAQKRGNEQAITLIVNAQNKAEKLLQEYGKKALFCALLKKESVDLEFSFY